MTKIMDMWMCGPFHNRSGVTVSWENVWTNSAMCKCTKSCNKTTYFVSKRNSIEKETSGIFDCARWFSLQSLNITIRHFKVCDYAYILSVYMKGKAGFPLTHGNKRISNRNLVLMFQQSENKITKWNLMGTDCRFTKNHCFYLSFLRKSRTNYFF